MPKVSVRYSGSMFKACVDWIDLGIDLNNYVVLVSKQAYNLHTKGKYTWSMH